MHILGPCDYNYEFFYTMGSVYCFYDGALLILILDHISTVALSLSHPKLLGTLTLWANNKQPSRSKQATRKEKHKSTMIMLK